MNFGKLLESIEIFKKYVPETEQEKDDTYFFPFDMDYMSIGIYLQALLLEKKDLERLSELGWHCNKTRLIVGAEYRETYSIGEDEIGNYEFSFSTRKPR